LLKFTSSQIQDGGWHQNFKLGYFWHFLRLFLSKISVQELNQLLCMMLLIGQKYSSVR